MSYTGVLTVSIVPAIGSAAVTDLDAAYLAALTAKKINELNNASAGTAMILLSASITKD